MGFFDQRPAQPPPPEPARPAWLPDEAVLPGAVPETTVLARTDDVVVALGDLHAYPNGFAFTLTVVLREPQREGGGRFLRHFHARPLPADFLRFGLRFADGTVLTNLDPRPADPDEEGPRLLPQGGSGGQRRHEQRYWVWPLPPSGPVDVVCEWPARGIPETTVALDGDVVREAAGRAVTLF
ncbi:hypothetical protein Val02_02090 [Virgisporangium aliadipatigenens]|uniref:Uncharacterized protein n=1 Tax=Virgisporangium aliadipatigenens TaxID=741659 RepID=A0A8J3YFI4_9ACTN|nr:hypothetical protein [Virgisporangium aliadipatigenens]GIJ43323.1 hypothetical protein Val02_02090 [Virgisporangium aliadipatigenens]